ncbi:MAG TPA: NrfD/PsrC family molybdoenzyme membrane anchor subunit [Nocardioidaceae bacterium]|nr:NrfD/PsrC family molybdoenzyme membrane anchor subunit [Nocardioidaceae bacterium]
MTASRDPGGTGGTETFDSYYGRPVIKAPVWKQPDVPLYLFVGGVAGVSAVLAEGAAVSGRPGLERWARLATAGGSTVGAVALIHDLGRPARFLNMLRVFKPTSPLSVGSWILAAFGGFSAVAAASNVTGRLPFVGRAAGLGAAALGPPLATYTAVLLCDTAVPAWHEAYREMPFWFAGSSAAAAGGLGVAAAPLSDSAPARRLALAGAAVDVAAEQMVRRRLGMLAEPYEQGRPGRLLRMARGLTLAGAGAAVLGRRSRALSVAGGAALAAGSLLTRFGVFQAGLASAEDPKYTVVPQRERVDRREGAATSG